MSHWHHSKKWNRLEPSSIQQGSENDIIEGKYLDKAYKMMSDKEYEQKYTRLVERLMAGKRMVKQTLGDSIDRG